MKLSKIPENGFFDSEKGQNDPLLGPKFGVEIMFYWVNSPRNFPSPEGNFLENARGAEGPEGDFQKFPEGRRKFLAGELTHQNIIFNKLFLFFTIA